MDQEHLPNWNQENILALLAFDEEHGKLVAANVSADLFEGDYRVIAMRLMEYWRQYSKPPGGAHLGDLLGDIIESKDRKANTYRHILQNLHVLSHDGINTEFVMTQLREFVDRQRQVQLLWKITDVMQRGGASTEVNQLLMELRRPDPLFKVGTQIGDLVQLRAHLAAIEQNEFLTGIKELDEQHIVPGRGKLMIFLGLAGAGKSWWLVHLGKLGIIQRKRVLHITLEMSEAETQKRYWQNLMALAAWRKHLKTTVTDVRVKPDKKSKTTRTDLMRREVKSAFSMQKPKFAAFHDYVKRFGGRCIIRQFPTRQLTVADLEGYLIGLEARHFVPDLLIIDYASLMKTDSDNYRITLGRLMEDLRGLAVRRNLALVTAHQVGRSALKSKKRVSHYHVAEDWSIVGTCDIILSLTSIDDEKKLKLARIFVDKNRNGVQDFGMIVSQNYEHGQFKLSSAPLLPDYLDEVYRSTDGENDDDDDDASLT